MNNKPDINTSSAGGYVDFTRFGKLREGAHRNQDAAIQQVADEFEAMFAELMLKAARESDQGEGMFDSSELDTYHEMLDGQLAQSLARSQDFGFGAMLKQQFAGALAAAKSEQAPGAASGLPALSTLNSIESPLAGGVPVISSALSILRTGDAPGVKAQRQGFLDELAPFATSAANSLGVEPRALMAQAALESGWGKHVIRMPDGSSSHNYFGIKASPTWTGAVVKVPTTEYIGGRAVTVNAAFRAYPDARSAFRDYVDFIGGNPRYEQALAHGANAAQYARQLEAAGYATDPDYANKIMAILSGNHFDGANSTPAEVSN